MGGSDLGVYSHDCAAVPFVRIFIGYIMQRVFQMMDYFSTNIYCVGLDSHDIPKASQSYIVIGIFVIIGVDESSMLQLARALRCRKHSFRPGV